MFGQKTTEFNFNMKSEHSCYLCVVSAFCLEIRLCGRLRQREESILKKTKEELVQSLESHCH